MFSTPLRLIASRDDENNLIQQQIDLQIERKKKIRILEAGCGRQWPYTLDRNFTHLTGIDIDPHAIKYRVESVNDLDTAVIGDLTTDPFDEKQFDIIYCAYVLEHIKNSVDVLSSFTSWLTDDGIMIILVPDPHSAHGFITRITPYWFHVFYYKYILKRPNAGVPGHNPYPTYYSHVISRKGIREFCIANQCRLVSEFGEGYWEPGNGVVRLAIKNIKKIVSLLSGFRLSSTHSNLIYIVSNKQTG